MIEKYMSIAIKEAIKARDEDEVPVGALIVKDGKILSKAHNKKESKKCSNYHAEMIAIEKACKKLDNWHLDDCDIYITMEPCPMCTGALINARVKNIYFGAYDKKAGCLGSVYNLMEDGKFNHKANVYGGICEGECANLLTEFFKKKRGK